MRVGRRAGLEIRRRPDPACVSRSSPQYLLSLNPPRAPYPDMLPKIKPTDDQMTTGSLSATGVATLKSISLPTDKTPVGFPRDQYAQQSARYARWRSWYDGDALYVTYTPEGETQAVPLFPIRIQQVRDICRRRSWVLFGEAPDTPEPLVKTTCVRLDLDGESLDTEPVVTMVPQPPAPAPQPKKSAGEEKKPAADGEKPAPAAGMDSQPPAQPIQPPKPKIHPDDKLALKCQNVVNQVWTQSNGRVIQQEGGLSQQFMGGAAYQVRWEPSDPDLPVPIKIDRIEPDYFLPIWDSKDMWWLHEAYVIYKISAQEAKARYGVTVDPGQRVVYMEHWTRESFSITVNNVPVTLTDAAGEKIYQGIENPFGFVPFVYIPTGRGSDRYGESVVDDVEGLVREFNARFANNGDLLREFAERIRYGVNLPSSIGVKKVGSVKVVNLGAEQVQHKHPPTITAEEPPNVPAQVVGFVNEIWKQILRQSGLTEMLYGEDQGTQRSAFGMAVKMWPSSATARSQRTYWTEGLNIIAKMILKMLIIMRDTPVLGDLGIDIPDDVFKRISIAQDWNPQIPRDAEQRLSDLVLRHQAGLLSARTAVQMFGDIRDPEVEFQRIMQEKQQMSLLAPQSGSPNPAEKKAPTQMNAPVATTGLEESK